MSMILGVAELNTKERPEGSLFCIVSQKEEFALDARHVRFLQPKCTNSTLREQKSCTTKQMK